MINNYNKSQRESYAKKLASEGNIDKAKEVIMTDYYTPIFKSIELHPEIEVSNEDFNDIFKDAGADLNILNNTISNSVSSFKDLLDTTRIKLDNIKSILKTEKERLEDVNILCNKYSDFSNVICITDNNTSGSLLFEDNAFSLNRNNYKTVKFSIENITGNGYEGNKYVYKNNSFLSQTRDTSNRFYINDASNLTYYEYSRIIASNSEKDVFPLVNFDSITARCSILLKADDLINTLDISMDTDDVILESLSTSLDGQTFSQSNLKNIAINDKNSRHNSESYIYGCGKLSFRDCYYVKLILKSTKYTNEQIAFVKKNLSTETIVELASAKRSVIRINNISASRAVYTSKGTLVFNNFITDAVNTISVFANEYSADDIDLRKSVQYTLTINGKDYDILPINSQSNGKKVIRTTSKALPADHVHYINESIKNATLTISLSTSKQYASPYISDLKILVGGE